MQRPYGQQLGTVREYADDLQGRLVNFLDYWPRRRRPRGRAARLAGAGLMTWGKARRKADEALNRFRYVARPRFWRSRGGGAVLALVVLGTAAGLVYWAYQSSASAPRAGEEPGAELSAAYGSTETAPGVA